MNFWLGPVGVEWILRWRSLPEEDPKIELDLPEFNELM